MEKDKFKTKVIFKMETYGENKDTWESCVAFFPEQQYSSKHDRIECYSHIGQHSGADIAYMNECKLATPEEYHDLKNELENGLGYNLKIEKDITE